MSYGTEFVADLTEKDEDSGILRDYRPGTGPDDLAGAIDKAIREEYREWKDRLAEDKRDWWERDLAEMLRYPSESEYFTAALEKLTWLRDDGDGNTFASVTEHDAWREAEREAAVARQAAGKEAGEHFQVKADALVSELVLLVGNALSPETGYKARDFSQMVAVQPAVQELAAWMTTQPRFYLPGMSSDSAGLPSYLSERVIRALMSAGTIGEIGRKPRVFVKN